MSRTAIPASDRPGLDHPVLTDFFERFADMPAVEQRHMFYILQRMTEDAHVNDLAGHWLEPGLPPEEKNRRGEVFLAALMAPRGRAS